MSGPLTGVDPGGLAAVLAGGGTAGIAWELGVLIGLEAEGVTLAHAARIIGTSAGSIVGTLLGSGLPLRDSGRRLLGPNPELPSDHAVPPAAMIAAQVSARWSDGPLSQAVRAELGQIALSASTVPLEIWLARMSATLGTDVWPAALVVTAVDAESGAFGTFDAGSGVPLAAAVAASCTIPGWFPPVPLDGRRWVDGGLRSTTNADLVGTADRIVVIAPLRVESRSRRRLEAELEPARTVGARVAFVLPNPAFLDSTGGNLMDPRFVAAAGAAGLSDGRRAAAEVRAVLAAPATRAAS